jgi:hypothetical protein
LALGIANLLCVPSRSYRHHSQWCHATGRDREPWQRSTNTALQTISCRAQEPQALADAIVHLLERRDELPVMGQRSRAIAERYGAFFQKVLSEKHN